MKNLKRVFNLELIKSETGGAFILGKIDYVSLLWIKGYLNEISKRKNPIYKIVKRMILKKLNSFFSDLKKKQFIKPEELLDFTKFYLSTKGYVNCNYIYGTVTSLDKSHNIEYFKLKVNTEMHKKNHQDYARVFVEISTSPSIYPNINIVRTINDDDRVRTTSIDRLFLDTTEDYSHEDMWKMICNYIKLVMETEWE